MEIVLGILIVLLLTMGYIIINLNNKVVKYEDIVSEQRELLIAISIIIQNSQKHLDELDTIGAFKSDDEIGFFFQQLINIQEELDRYALTENYGETEIKE